MRPALYDFVRSFSKLYMILVLIIFALGAVGSGLALKFVMSSVALSSPVNLIGYSTEKYFLGYVFDSSGTPVSYTAKLVLINGSAVMRNGTGTIDVSFPPNTIALLINTSYNGSFTVTPGQGAIIRTSNYFINGQYFSGSAIGPDSFAYIALVATGGQSYGSPQKLVMIGFNVTGQDVTPLRFTVQVQGKNVTVQGFGTTEIIAKEFVTASVVVGNVANVVTFADAVPTLFATLTYTGFEIMVGLLGAVFPLVSLYSVLLNVVRSIESGSLKFLVAQPVKRYQIVFNRYLSSLLTIIVVATVFAVIVYSESVAVASPYGVSFPPSTVLGFALAVILPQAAYLSLLLFIASLVSRGWQFSLISVTAYVFLFYVIPITVSMLGLEAQLLGSKTAPNYDWLYYIGFGGLSGYIFSQVSGVSGLTSISLSLPAVIADLIAWIAFPLALAVYRFNRRDF